MGTTVDRWSLFETAPALVTEKFEIAQEYAQNAYRMAMEAIRSLIDIAGELELINTNITIDEIGVFTPGSLTAIPPTKPDFSMEFPNAPSEPTNLIDVVFGQLPKFPDPPATGGIGAGDNSYTSSLISALQSKLLADLQDGGNGIDPDIETALFQRESERAFQVHNDAKDRIASEWSKRGFSIPSGALAAMLMEEEINFTNKRLDISRDIAIKSFELAQANTHFAIQQAIGLESALLNWTNSVAERVFQVSKAVVDRRSPGKNRIQQIADLSIRLFGRRF